MSMSNILHVVGLCILLSDAAYSNCQDGWTRFGESCYLFGHEDQTFMDAQRFCEHFKANLANINSSAENTFIESYLQDLKDAEHWIGLTDVLVEGLWKHYPSEITAQFFDWAPGQPNGQKNANCGVIWASYNYHWADNPCTERYKALCEKPAERAAIIG